MFAVLKNAFATVFGDLSGRRFATLPAWLQVTGWIGVGSAYLFWSSLIIGLFVAAFGFPPKGMWSELFGVMCITAASTGAAAHLLVHNPFRRNPFTRAWMLREHEIARVAWLCGVIGWIGFVALAVPSTIPSQLPTWVSVVSSEGLFCYLALFYFTSDRAEVLTAKDRPFTYIATEMNPHWKRTFVFSWAIPFLCLFMYWLIGAMPGDAKSYADVVLKGRGLFLFLWGDISFLLMPVIRPLPLEAFWRVRFLPLLASVLLYCLSLFCWIILARDELRGEPVVLGMWTPRFLPLVIGGSLYLVMNSVLAMWDMIRKGEQLEVLSFRIFPDSVKRRSS